MGLEIRPSVVSPLLTEILEMETVLVRSMSVAVSVPEVVRAASVSVRDSASELRRELTERTGSSLAPLMVMTTSCVSVSASGSFLTPESSVMVMR